MNSSSEREMNRGFLQLLVLLVLERPFYGYTLMGELGELGYPVEESSLYPLLRRLESRGFLVSRWEIEDGKPRKYYSITDQGRDLKGRLLEAFRLQSRVLDRLTGGVDGE